MIEMNKNSFRGNPPPRNLNAKRLKFSGRGKSESGLIVKMKGNKAIVEQLSGIPAVDGDVRRFKGVRLMKKTYDKKEKWYAIGGFAPYRYLEKWIEEE
jgi:hypothetical protein